MKKKKIKRRSSNPSFFFFFFQLVLLILLGSSFCGWNFTFQWQNFFIQYNKKMFMGMWSEFAISNAFSYRLRSAATEEIFVEICFILHFFQRYFFKLEYSLQWHLKGFSFSPTFVISAWLNRRKSWFRNDVYQCVIRGLWKFRSFRVFLYNHRSFVEVKLSSEITCKVTQK